MVSNPDCAKFISNLINATVSPKNPAEFTNALDGFDAIRKQGGFVYGDTVRRLDGIDAGTIHGTMSDGAQVELPFPKPFRSIGPVNQRVAASFAEAQAGREVMTALHEIIHLAGKNIFDDFAFANAISDIRRVPRQDFTKMTPFEAVQRASERWGNALEAACKPR